MSKELDIEEAAKKIETAVRNTLREHWKLYALQGGLMIVLGVAAIALPQVASLTLDILLGWLLFLTGVLGTYVVFHAGHLRQHWGNLLLGVVTGVLGVLIAMWPESGLITLTFALVFYLVLHGVTRLAFAFAIRHDNRPWVWLIVGSIIDFVLAGVIIFGWPGTASWVLGLMLGVSLLFGGATLLSAAISARDD